MEFSYAVSVQLLPLGRIRNKFLIIDIVASAHETQKGLLDFLYGASRSLRRLLLDNLQIFLNMTAVDTFTLSLSKHKKIGSISPFNELAFLYSA